MAGSQVAAADGDGGTLVVIAATCTPPDEMNSVPLLLPAAGI
jgi:hypothetical protein